MFYLVFSYAKVKQFFLITKYFVLNNVIKLKFYQLHSHNEPKHSVKDMVF